jgi:hypothetical protein
MKMGKSKFRRLEEMTLRTINKTEPVAEPKNRAQRRLAAKLARLPRRAKEIPGKPRTGD